MRKAKVLITGGAGFIGYHLSLYLSQRSNCSIDIVDNLSRGRLDKDFMQLLKRKNVRFIKADLLKNDSYSKLGGNYDYIYHLCAVVGVKNVTRAPDRVLCVNILSVLYTLEWIRKTQKNLKRFLFLSTSEVYAGTLRHYGVKIPTDESVNLCLEDISSQRSTYALSKMAGESACYAYLNNKSMPFTIVRYHNVYGPRMGYDHVIPELLCRAKHSAKSFKVYSSQHTRAFCYVSDAVNATVALAQNKNTSGQVFHIGNGTEEIKIGTLAKKIRDLVNPDLEIRLMPAQQGSPVRRCPDTSKAHSAIGFVPEIPLDDGLRLTWDWYSKHLSKVTE